MAARKKREREGAADTEEAFLAAYDPSRFERLSVAVDVALIAAFDGALYTLAVRRAEHPHRGRWALPGGFVRVDESLDAAASRALATKAGLSHVYLEQLYTFGAPRRDPRTRVISVAYCALVDRARFEAARAEGGGPAIARIVVPWEGETGGPVELEGEAGEPMATAFDHAEILGMAVKRIRGKLDYTPIGFQLLPERFTLLELMRVHETVLGRPLNKDSFRRRMLASGQLEATGESEKDVDHRPAELYRFAKRSAV
ncbi:MAG: NUDIX domain-containing protein [Polyangiaceae bacterium]|nr:NUDIX domain-containing protein [Polyangiaceae bacterium]